MAIGQSANIASLTEKSSSQLFPIEPEIQSKVPVWMKFFCYEYNSSALGRASAYSRSQGGTPILTKLKTQIAVPAPVNFETNNQLAYTKQLTPAIGAFGLPTGAITALANQIPGAATVLNQLASAAANLSEIPYTLASSVIGSVTGFGSEVGQDMHDLQFVGTGPTRQFNIQIYLPCLTWADSVAAGNIIRSFESFSLPTMFTTGLGGGLTARYYHPPLWTFGIGPIGSFAFDKDWCGEPQLSVLKTVKTKRIPLDVNFISAFSNSGSFKPVAYTVGLIFAELEPSVRVTLPGEESSTSIMSRSRAIVQQFGAQVESALEAIAEGTA